LRRTIAVTVPPRNMKTPGIKVTTDGKNWKPQNLAGSNLRKPKYQEKYTLIWGQKAQYY
jgi:hypothetical protein